MSALINVVNQKMCIHSPLDEFVSDSQEFVRFEFIFDKNWSNLVTFAQFAQNGRAYNKYLDEKNSVCLPPEIKEGTCTLMLYGSKDKVIATTNYLTFKINKSNFISDAQSTEITESLYNQLVSKVDLFISETTEYIDKSIEAEMLHYLESGQLANLTIEDGSITRDKLSDDVLSLSGAAPSITNTIIGGGKSLTVNDVSPLAHKCSLRLTSDDGNIYELNEANFELMNPPASLYYYIDENGLLILDGYAEEEGATSALFYLKNLTKGEQYTFSILNNDGSFSAPDYVFYLEENGGVGGPIENTVINGNYATFTPTESRNCVAIMMVETSYDEMEVSFYPQLVVGGSPVEKNIDFTKVKVYVNGKTYTPTADGTVTNIESISPTMEITTDNKYVNICDFTYCADTKKYVEKYTEARLKGKVLLDVTLTEEQAGVTSVMVAIPNYQLLKKAKYWNIRLTHPYSGEYKANSLWYDVNICNELKNKYNVNLAGGYNTVFSTSANIASFSITVFNTLFELKQGGGSLISYYLLPNCSVATSSANTPNNARCNAYHYDNTFATEQFPAYLEFKTGGLTLEAGTRLFLEVIL